MYFRIQIYKLYLYRIISEESCNTEHWPLKIQLCHDSNTLYLKKLLYKCFTIFQFLLYFCQINADLLCMIESMAEVAHMGSVLPCSM